MRPAGTALVRNDVFYRNADASGRMPPGEYALALDDDLRVAFRQRGEGASFSLALDTVIQHIFEGRMQLTDGKLI